MFAGIGQVLLVADRMRSRPAGLDTDQPAAARFQGAAALQDAAARRGAGVRPAAADRLSADGAPATGPGGSRWRSLDKTGNVRILPVEYQPGRPAVPAAEPPSPVEPVLAEPVLAEPVHIDKPGPAELPVPNYDDLSLASLRARLRTLDSGQLLMLLDYEKANAARPAVLTMFERRISKLETGQG
jgi:hypothetical protein